MRHAGRPALLTRWGRALQDHINEEIARLNALEERIMNESGPDDERLQVGLQGCLHRQRSRLQAFAAIGSCRKQGHGW